MNDLAVTGLGAVTSVGMDAVTTCASIRAGLTRSAPLDHGIVMDIVGYQEVAITGHPAGTIARGFSNVGRWLQLAPVALADLCSTALPPTTAVVHDFWAHTVCIAVLPVLGERFFPDPNCSDEVIERTFVAPLEERVRSFFRPARMTVQSSGRTGVLDAFAAAADTIARNPAARVVVLVVDSLVDIAAINWLTDWDRVKSDDNPVGLSPGEAACAFLVESSAAAIGRGSAPIAYLRAVGTAPEPRTFMAGEISQGEALAGVIKTVLAQSNADGPFTGAVVADLNGETWRAQEFGTARARISSTLWDSSDLVLPVGSTGDAGAATIGIQVAVACQALARGYAGGHSLLITCSDEEGMVGAAVLAAEPPAN